MGRIDLARTMNGGILRSFHVISIDLREGYFCVFFGSPKFSLFGEGKKYTFLKLQVLHLPSMVCGVNMFPGALPP
jgi:hypothetical protein